VTADDQYSALRRSAFLEAKRVVIKIGSRLIAESPAGRPAAIADEIAYLRGARGLETVIVSSGAIALGVRILGLDTRPTDLPRLQAAAAVGQGRLLQHWEHAFSAHDIRMAQILITHDDIRDRSRFLNARHALRALLDAGVVPIVNENDTVAVEEIKYGDNDLIAALICNHVSADALIVLTDMSGLRDDTGARVRLVRDIDAEAVPLARGSSGDGIGSGGMASKVQAAKVAVRSGVATAIVAGRDRNVLAETLGGADVGTLFMPEGDRISSRKHWIAYGPRPAGSVVVDGGAHQALASGGRSLLPAGVLDIAGSFELGDIVSIVDESGTEFARGLAGYRAEDMRKLQGIQTADIEATLGYKYLNEVIHRDDLVLL
jgi:glutamate 5-kinase